MDLNLVRTSVQLSMKDVFLALFSLMCLSVFIMLSRAGFIKKGGNFSKFITQNKVGTELGLTPHTLGKFHTFYLKPYLNFLQTVSSSHVPHYFLKVLAEMY